jgi:hypothetical protein
VNKYLGQVNNSVSLEMVQEHITAKDVSIVELEQLNTKHSRFKSFRLRVKRNDLSKVEDPNFWPQNVILKPFFRGKTPNTKNDGSNAASAA